MTLNPKALEAAARASIRANAEELLSKPTIENAERAITAYLSALPSPAEAEELVAKLRATGIGAPSWVTHEAADLIQSLTARLEAAAAKLALTQKEAP